MPVLSINKGILLSLRESEMLPVLLDGTSSHTQQNKSGGQMLADLTHMGNKKREMVNNVHKSLLFVNRQLTDYSVEQIGR